MNARRAGARVLGRADQTGLRQEYMPYRQDRTLRFLALAGAGLTVLVFVGYVLDLPLMRTLAGNSGITTLWTGATLFLLFAHFLVSSRAVEQTLLVAATLLQLTSMGLLLFESFPVARWLVPSSTTTTIFIALALGVLASRNLPWRWLSRALFSLLAPLPLLFAWAARNHHLGYLGVQPEIPGLGMSSTTIFLGVLLVACAHLACFRFVGINVKNRPLRVWRPLTILFSAQLVAGMEFPISEAAAELLVTGLDLLSFAALYHLLAHGRFEDRDNAVTVCAWTQRVRVSDGRWLKLDEFLTEAGFRVSHGIHPDALESVLDRDSQTGETRPQPDSRDSGADSSRRQKVE